MLLINKDPSQGGDPFWLVAYRGDGEDINGHLGKARITAANLGGMSVLDRVDTVYSRLAYSPIILICNKNC